MDKFLGLLMVLGIGVPLITMSFLISWVMDEDVSKGQLHNDSDIRIYIPSKYRRGRGVDRHNTDFTKGEKK